MYVYQFDKKAGGGLKSNLLFDKPLHGIRKPGARFGAAVSNIGDIDGDGMEDFAVAAPDEEQEGPDKEQGGAVYIYRGHEYYMLKGTHYQCAHTCFISHFWLTGISEELPQRLSPKEIGHPLWKGFGMSIQGGVDVDNHAKGDLAIGATGRKNSKGNVVVLRTLDVAFFKPDTEVVVDPAGAIKLEDKGKA